MSKELVEALRDFATESEHTELMKQAADLIEKQDRLIEELRAELASVQSEHAELVNILQKPKEANYVDLP